MSRAPTYKEMPIGAAREGRAQAKTGSWRMFKPVVDKGKCTKCGLCVIYCPEASCEMTDEGIKYNFEYCKGCGICANECPVGAVTMVREEL